jgi:hypothetical protein
MLAARGIFTPGFYDIWSKEIELLISQYFTDCQAGSITRWHQAGRD